MGKSCNMIVQGVITVKKEPILVILAAGMGSRFGGMKQTTAVDAEGDFILDFSLFDAYRAGFRRVAFIIKPEMESDFRERVGSRLAGKMEVCYVHQTLDILPDGFRVPENRVKPWGTGHAVACCRGVIDAPFTVINSDDYYGSEAFAAIYRFLTQSGSEDEYALVGYRLKNTVSDSGAVARGVCESKDGYLTSITERTTIFKRGENAEFTEDGEHFTPLAGDTLVSMNFWGFTPKFMDALWTQFPTFLREKMPQNPEKAEFFLPFAVDEQLQKGEVRVRMLECGEKWYGVTYREDLQTVYDALSGMKTNGKYPKQLW